MPCEEAHHPASMLIFLQSLAFRIRCRLPKLISFFRCIRWRRLGMQIGGGTTLETIRTLLWPHQVQIGRGCSLLRDVTIDYCHGTKQPGPSIVIGDRCYIGRGVEFNVCSSVRIGNDCLIAAGCRLIDHDHGTALNAGPMKQQRSDEAPIKIGNDVWLGANVIVLKGVVIVDGAIVAAAAVVTESIPGNEICAGVPARHIGKRE